MSEKTIAVEVDIKNIFIRRALFQEPDRSVDGYSATLGLLPKIEVEENGERIHVTLTVKALYEKPDEKDAEPVVVGILEAEFIYQIQGVEGFERTETQIRVPNSLAASLLHDAYATVRGIWHAKTIGMRANSAILPVKEPAQLLEVFLSEVQRSEHDR